MTSLEYRLQPDPDLTVIVLKGRLDGNSSAPFGQFLREQLSAEQTRVVLDIGGLVFLSSAGLRELLMLAKSLRKLGAKAALANVQPQVSDVLEMAGFVHFFHVCADLPAARALLSGKSGGAGLLARLFAGKPQA